MYRPWNSKGLWLRQCHSPIVEAYAEHLGHVARSIDPEIPGPSDRVASGERRMRTRVSPLHPKPSALINDEGVEARLQGKILYYYSAKSSPRCTGESRSV